MGSHEEHAEYLKENVPLRVVLKMAKDVEGLAEGEDISTQLSFLRQALELLEDVVLPKAEKQKRATRSIRENIAAIEKKIADLEREGESDTHT